MGGGSVTTGCLRSRCSQRLHPVYRYAILPGVRGPGAESSTSSRPAAGDGGRVQRVVLLPGDGIGPEVVREAAKVLRATAPAVELAEQPIGAAAMERTGSPLPEPTLAACLEV